MTFALTFSLADPAYGSEDPLFGNAKEQRNRSILDNIEQRVQVILHEYNRTKVFSGVDAQTAYINEKLELLFLGIDPESWSRRLSSETGSLQKICYLNSLIDTLEFASRVESNKSFLNKDISDKLRIISQRCSAPRKTTS